MDTYISGKAPKGRSPTWPVKPDIPPSSQLRRWGAAVGLLDTLTTKSTAAPTLATTLVGDMSILPIVDS